MGPTLEGGPTIVHCRNLRTQPGRRFNHLQAISRHARGSRPTRKTSVFLVNAAGAAACGGPHKKTRCAKLRKVTGCLPSILVDTRIESTGPAASVGRASQSGLQGPGSAPAGSRHQRTATPAPERGDFEPRLTRQDYSVGAWPGTSVRSPPRFVASSTDRSMPGVPRACRLDARHEADAAQRIGRSHPLDSSLSNVSSSQII